VDVFELSASNDEIIQVMRSLCDKGSYALPKEMLHELVDFISDAGSSRQLSLRLFEPSIQKVLYAAFNGCDWRDLVRSQLEAIGAKKANPIDGKAQEIEMLRRSIAKFQSPKEQQEFWSRATGKSRASFYRLRKEVIND